MKISVIIPTYNRLNILKKCLKHLKSQALKKEDFEVIIIDDGSTDKTAAEIPSYLKKINLQASFNQADHGGPAKARNIGIKKAVAPILLIMGDDIFLKKDSLEKHIESHHEQPEKSLAVLGKIEWDPEMEITSFMRYLDNGLQFDYKNITNKNINYRHCYTANISIKKQFIVDNNTYFSETFPYAAFEDTEWGFRLSKKGIRFTYQPNALGYHHHPVTLDSYSKRMVYAGKAWSHLIELHPDMKKDKNNTKSRSFLMKKVKGRLREFVLKSPVLCKSLKKLPIGFDEEKWVRSVLGYYLEKGIQESSQI